MDYQQEKENEIEALQSIYMENIKIIDEDKLEIDVFPSLGEKDEQSLGMTLNVSFSPKYPEEPLYFSLSSLKGLTRNECDELKSKIDESIKDFLGSVYIFNIVTLIQEDLQQKMDEIEKQTEEELTLEKIREEKELEQQRLAQLNRFTKDSEYKDVEIKGTPVTIEIFEKWKKEFDKKTIKKEKEESQKLTGRQLFEQKTKWVDESILKEVDEEMFDDELFLEE